MLAGLDNIELCSQLFSNSTSKLSSKISSNTKNKDIFDIDLNLNNNTEIEQKKKSKKVILEPLK